MSLFWYPEINEKYGFDSKPDKDMLLSSYINYYLARLQSMFRYEGLPDTIPQKWLENLLLVNGSCVFIQTEEDGLFVNRATPGGEGDVYYIPTTVVATNPWAKGELKNTYTRDVDCVVMFNDTYAQGLLPMLKKYCSMMVENDITMNIADIMSRASVILSAIDDNTKDSARLFIKRLFEGDLSIIGETGMLLANQDKDLSINQLTGANGTLTNLIEYHQYLKASLFNELGLNSNYNMKRESINSNESQLNDDMLHPLIDTMLECRKEAVKKVNDMFGTNISVEFNSAWEMNEIEEEAAVEEMTAGVELVEAQAEAAAEVPEVSGSEGKLSEDIATPEEQLDETETETAAEAEEQTEGVELTEETIEEIAEAVVEKIEESEGDSDDNEEDQ